MGPVKNAVDFFSRPTWAVKNRVEKFVEFFSWIFFVIFIWFFIA